MRKIRSKIKPAQVFVIGFIIIILTGMLLLSLPVSSPRGMKKDFFTVLFTAVSATCVTGSGILGINANWSGFGQFVILALVQLGGLGFMSLLTVFHLFFKRPAGLRHRLLVVQSLNLNSMNGVMRMAKNILTGTLIFEGAGAVILTARLAPDIGLLSALKNGIFLSVSAFCNAGIDMLGAEGGLRAYGTDFTVNVTLMLLVIIGGIGFFVWEDIVEKRGLRGAEVYTGLVLRISLALILGGALLFYVFESGNASTLATMGTWHRIQASLFQSVSMRTAGFAMIDQNLMTEGSKALSLILMFIGASSGSTGGGVKIVTVAVLLMSSYSALRGRENTVVLGRMIKPRQVTNALAIFVVGLFVTAVGAFSIALLDGVSFFTALYDATAAFSTTGVGIDEIARLGYASKSVLMFLMFFGRIGLLTLGFAVLSRRVDRAHVTYPDAQIMIG